MFKCKSDTNILLFFGSGISLPTGLPNTNQLTDEILNGEWSDHTTGVFVKKIPKPRLLELDDNMVPKLQTFLRIIQQDADQYLSKRNRPNSNYEVLYYICYQIKNELNGEFDNPTISDYIDSLQGRLGELIVPLINRPDRRIDLKSLASDSCDLIQSVVWKELTNRLNPVGMDLILELINVEQFKNVNIVTINHDLLIERLLDNANISYNNGFGDQDGDVRWFSPNSYFSGKEKTSIYKLHGSINWHVYRTIDRVTGNGLDRYAMVLGNDAERCIDGIGQDLLNISTLPKILTGSYNKLFDYNFGIIRQIHCAFDYTLNFCNTVIMSGYGWNDRGINGRMFEWLESSDNNRIILLHENPTNLRDNSKSAMWHRYDNLVSSQKLIPIRKWLAGTTIDDINEILF